MTGGIYIHVPFCRSKCAYCAFCSAVWDEESGARYAARLEREIEEYRERFPLQAESLYLGGGTPALLPLYMLERIIMTACEAFDLLPDAEITLEANPDSVTRRKAEGWFSMGINRISLGVQGSDDRMLKLLSRPHTFAQARDAVTLLRQSGFDNISIDLMCGLPGQSPDDWHETLNRVITWQTEHFSVYPLQVEEGTPLAAMVNAGQVTLPTDDETVAMLETAARMLGQAGYQRYEIANYALAGHQGRHNSNYWRLKPYLGLGPAAASYYNGVRWQNPCGLDEWSRGADEDVRQIDRDSLLPEVQMAEYAFLALRLLQEGLSEADFLKRFGLSLQEVHGPALAEMVSWGWLTEQEDRYLLAGDMIPYANEIFQRLLPTDR